jgi:nucleoside-diphosphate-sugar epimerase
VTDDKDFKRLVRARMAETGQSYTQARAALRAADADPSRSSDERSLPRDARIFVTGHRGLVGSALLRRLQAEGHTGILTATRDQLDLRDQAAVSYWFRANRPDYVFLVAGTVGGIMANATRPAEFLYDNMLMPRKVLDVARLHGLGWRAGIDLRAGLEATYAWYLAAPDIRGQHPTPAPIPA